MWFSQHNLLSRLHRSAPLPSAAIRLGIPQMSSDVSLFRSSEGDTQCIRAAAAAIRDFPTPYDAIGVGDAGCYEAYSVKLYEQCVA